MFVPYWDKRLIRLGGYGLHTDLWLQQESTFWRADLLKLLDYEKLKHYKLAGDFYMWYQFSEFNECYLLNSIVSGFRHRENQLSSNYKNYLDEMKSLITSNPTKYENKILSLFKKNIYCTATQNIEYPNIIYPDIFGDKEWKLSTSTSGLYYPKNILEYIFSVREGTKFKYIYIFGIKISIKK